MFREFLKVLGKVARREKGYTLIEVSAVVAITATLGAVIVPITLDKIEDTKIAAAVGDVSSLSQAFQTLFQQTGDWPTRKDQDNDDHYELLYSAEAVTENGVAVAGEKHVVFASSASGGAGAVEDALFNHLIVNNSGYVAWEGPYISADTYDPWGRSYVIYVRPLHKDDIFGGVAWILSGGPDGEIDTDITSTAVLDDDIGVKMAGETIEIGDGEFPPAL